MEESFSEKKDKLKEEAGDRHLHIVKEVKKDEYKRCGNNSR